MTLLKALRHRQVRIARAVTVLFAASWLGLAVQPCVAGAAAPETLASGHGAMGHGPAPSPESTAEHDCPHCPPAPASGHDCSKGVALDCDAVSVPILPAKDPGDTAWPNVLHGAGPGYQVDWTTDRQGGWSADPATWRPPDRPLQQRFCTYLK
jgi:hypothetical protein